VQHSSSYAPLQSSHPDASPKLDLERRCQVLALRYLGVTVRTLALRYNLNESTVRDIYRESSKRYRDVRDICSRLGKRDSVKRFVPRAVFEEVVLLHPVAVNEAMNSLYITRYDLND
jgi:hypothetical protein